MNKFVGECVQCKTRFDFREEGIHQCYKCKKLYLAWFNKERNCFELIAYNENKK